MGKKQIIAKRKQELTLALAQNRMLISQGKKQIKQNLNIKTQLTRLINRKPKALFAGSLAAGLAATFLLKRKKVIVEKKNRSNSNVLFGWALTLIKPAAKAWLMNKAKKMAVAKIASQSGPQPRTDQTIGS